MQNLPDDQRSSWRSEGSDTGGVEGKVDGLLGDHKEREQEAVTKTILTDRHLGVFLGTGRDLKFALDLTRGLPGTSQGVDGEREWPQSLW